MIQWTKAQARDFIVNYQMINSAQKPSIKDVFARIKTIQYDPLNIVGTNPELVLQSRIANFNKESLQEALYDERYLIDGWDKQMCIYQTADFEQLKTIRDHRANESLKAYKHYFNIDVLSYQEQVLEIIRQKGPIFAKDISIGDTVSTGWGKTKISTATIDYLFHKGLIGISKRNNTQKKYDLMERLMTVNTKEPLFATHEDFLDYYLERRIRMKGLVWNKASNLFTDAYLKSKTIRSKHFQRLLVKGTLAAIQVEDIKETFYIPKDALTIPINIVDKIVFIAPLDNLIWDREMIKTLFNFDYRWEVYTPAKKRVYGYYVLPILRGSTFIGRIEFENHQPNEPLEIKNIWFENGMIFTKQRDSMMASALKSFAAYLNVESINYIDKI